MNNKQETMEERIEYLKEEIRLIEKKIEERNLWNSERLPKRSKSDKIIHSFNVKVEVTENGYTFLVDDKTDFDGIQKCGMPNQQLFIHSVKKYNEN